MGVASEYRGPLTFKWLVVQDAKDSWNSGGQRQYPQDRSLFPSNAMSEIDGRIACFPKKSAIRTAPRYCAFAIWNWESLQTHTPIWITSIELCPFPSKATVMSGQYLHYTHTHTHTGAHAHTPVPNQLSRLICRCTNCTNPEYSWVPRMTSTCGCSSQTHTTLFWAWEPPAPPAPRKTIKWLKKCLKWPLGGS